MLSFEWIIGDVAPLLSLNDEIRGRNEAVKGRKIKRKRSLGTKRRNRKIKIGESGSLEFGICVLLYSVQPYIEVSNTRWRKTKTWTFYSSLRANQR